ncbi:MAG: DUF917 domain-containing protein [Chloroflexota bacterium]|nr:DUF917 domain-containing protein [Chloroflexota bacterium]
MRLLDEENIDDIAVGAAILGSGGGSNPYIGKLMAREAIRRYGPVELYALGELADDDLIVPSAGMGAPVVAVEKLPAGDDIVRAFQALGKYTGRAPRATMSVESGGMNSIRPIYLAARLGIPVVDCDGMGRAFPEIQMTVLTAYGISASPFAMSDERGNMLLIDAVSNRWVETFARSCVTRMGAIGAIALYSATVKQLKAAAIHGTTTLAEKIGRTVREARLKEKNPVDAIRLAVDGFLVFRGKISDVDRRVSEGFAKGGARMTGSGAFAGQALQLDFQNEHLVLCVDGDYVATTPDLIAVLDSETGAPITTEALRYGMRVAVIAFPCAPQWREPAALALVCPRYFGYDIDYVPVEERFAS